MGLGDLWDSAVSVVEDVADVAVDVVSDVAGAAVSAVGGAAGVAWGAGGALSNFGSAISAVADTAAEGLGAAYEAVETVAETAAPFAGMIGTAVGGPVGGMIGNAVGAVIRGEDPWDVVERTILAAVEDPSALVGMLIGPEAGALVKTFTGGDADAILSSVLDGDFEGLATKALGVAVGSATGDGGGSDLFSTALGAVGLSGDTVDVVGAAASIFGVGGAASGAPPGGSWLDGVDLDGAYKALAGQFGGADDAGVLGAVFGDSAPDLADVMTFVQNLDDPGALANQVMAAASDQFGAPDLGVFGDALEGLGVNPSMLKGADDLISNLSVDKAAQFIDQLSEGELPAFASGLSAKGAVDLFDRFTGSGQDIGAAFNKLGGADGPGALLGKIAEGGRLDETLGKLGQDELVSLIKTMVPTTQAPSDAPVQVAGLDGPAGQPRYEADPVTGTDGVPGPRTDREVDSPAFETDPATGAMVRPRAVQDDALGIENVEAMVQEPIVRSGDEAVLRTFDRTDGGQQQMDGGLEPADAPSVTTMDDPVFAEQAATVSYEDTNDDGGDFSAPPAEDEGGYDEVTDEVFGAE